MHKFFKNFILCGELEYYCLLCRETFLSLDDVDKHVRWETHRKIMKDQIPFPKLKKDSIYKIEENFYCELCNYFTLNLGNINAHVKDEKHKNAKTSKTVNPFFVDCKRDDETGFIIVSDIIVNIHQWNAFETPKLCLLCNITVESRHADRHLVSNEHTIKLIQARVVLEGPGRCYRKINESLNYCFVCKKSVSTDDLDDHWDSQQHTDNMSASITRMTKSTETKMNKEIYQTSEAKRKMMEMQKLLYNIDLKNMTATCKFCELVVPFLGRAMLTHQKDHIDQLKDKDDSSEMLEIIVDTMNVSLSDEEIQVEEEIIIDNGRRKKELARIGKKHYIKLVPGGGKGYCEMCNAYMPGHLNTFKQHIRGAVHRGQLEVRGLKKLKSHEKQNYSTKPLKDYIKNIHHAHRIRIFWINKDVSIHTHSFVLVCPVTKNPHYKKTKCYACQVEYTQGEDEKHYKNMKHKNNFLDAEVITNFKGEFIREIRTDVYHCGFCNRTIPYWDNLKAHLRTHRHKNMKKHKDDMTEALRKWHKDNMLSVVSTNLDIMYVQMLELGIFN